MVVFKTETISQSNVKLPVVYLNRYGQLLVEEKHKSGKLLSEANREIDIQRRLQESEVKRRESLAAFQQTNKENQQIIDVRDKQVFIKKSTY